MKTKKPAIKPSWEMTTAELEELAKVGDEEFLFERTKPLSPEMRARWEAVKAKGDAPTNGKIEVIAVRASMKPSSIAATRLPRRNASAGTL